MGMAYSSPIMVDCKFCGKPVRGCLNLRGQRIIETKCSWPRGHTGPCALVYYESIGYENAEEPNRSTDTDLEDFVLER